MSKYFLQNLAISECLNGVYDGWNSYLYCLKCLGPNAKLQFPESFCDCWWQTLVQTSKTDTAFTDWQRQYIDLLLCQTLPEVFAKHTRLKCWTKEGNWKTTFSLSFRIFYINGSSSRLYIDRTLLADCKFALSRFLFPRVCSFSFSSPSLWNHPTL